ncbi:MAG TPA: hypothetical protein VNE82_21915 [Candidatus Binataceae bacterium]|nr:hypothetical protein [Candidatus Binataceae bacterium]HVB82592.1 hypothetical protein [Candidatus Binataceae bacterium]
MTLQSLPVLPNDIPQNALQLVPFSFGQIRFLSLGIDRQQKHRQVFARVKCDHTIPTAFSLTATRDTNLAGAASPADLVTSFRVIGEQLNHRLPVAFRQAGDPGVSEIWRCLDEPYALRLLYRIAV